MGALKEVTGAVLPYAILAGVAGAVYLYRDKIWEFFTKDNPVSQVQELAYNAGYDAGQGFMNLSDRVKCSLGDQNACARVAWVDAGSPSVTPTTWPGDPDNITIGNMSLLPSGLLTSIYGPPIEEQINDVGTGPTTDADYYGALAGVSPAKPITGPLKPGTFVDSLPDLVNDYDYQEIVNSFGRFSAGFDIIDVHDNLLLYRSESGWGVIDTGQFGLDGSPGKTVNTGLKSVPIPYGVW